MDLNLDKSLLKRLELMRIVSRGVFGGNSTGERRSIYRGVGIEFADHRQYSPGDDFRYIDWNVLARTNEIFIKLFDRQEAVPLYMLVDSSDSMRVACENGSQTTHVSANSKFERAIQIAAGLTHVGLCDGDMIQIATFTNTVTAQSNRLTHRREMLKLGSFFDGADGGGQTSFTDSLSYFGKRTSKRGIVFILSDFLDAQGVKEGLQSLLYRKFHVCGIHIASRAEYNPTFTGELEFVDSESGAVRQVRVRKSTLDRYKQAFEEHQKETEKFFHFYGGDYVITHTEDSLEDVLTKEFRHAGILE